METKTRQEGVPVIDLAEQGNRTLFALSAWAQAQESVYAKQYEGLVATHDTRNIAAWTDAAEMAQAWCSFGGEVDREIEARLAMSQRHSECGCMGVCGDCYDGGPDDSGDTGDDDSPW